jgi:hypothetical protein
VIIDRDFKLKKIRYSARSYLTVIKDQMPRY